MRRLVAVALLAFLIPACQEDVEQAVAPDDVTVRGQKGGSGGSPEESSLEGKIEKLLNELFPGQKQDDANALFADVKSALAAGDTTAARSSLSDLVQLASSTDLEDPKGSRSAAEGFSDLIDLLFEFAGLEPPEVDPALLTDDDDDGTVQMALDGQDNLILSDSVWAGTFIEDEDLDQDLLIVLERLTTNEQDTLPTGECLPDGSLQQAEGCYQFDRFPEGVFQDTVKVGVCPEAAIDGKESYQLHEFENEGDGGVEGIAALKSVPFSQLDCGTFTVVQSPESPLPWRLAEAAWSATGGRLLRWFGPAPLRAIDSGDGGSTLDYSRIGWAKNMDVDIVEGDGQTAPAGNTLSTDPKVKVTHKPEGNGQRLGDVTVSFSITQGGGSLGSSSVQTNASGTAAVSWTLGTSPGTKELTASVAGDDTTFTATAVNPGPDVDALVARFGSSVVWENDGTGSFAIADSFPGGDSFGVALGDLDGDGDLDAFFANDLQNTVWTNDGSGNFTDTGQRLGGSQSEGLALGDLDGDGDLDAFVGNRTPTSNHVYENIAPSQDSFIDTSQSLGNGHSEAVALGDLDGDGDLDAFVGNSLEPNRVWTNDGSLNFSDSGQTLGNTSTHGVALGDLDGDGDLDAFVSNTTANRVWTNDGSGNFTDTGQTLGSSDTGHLELGDLDGDGDLDAFVPSSDGANRVWTNDGSGNFTDSGQTLGSATSWTAALGDLDGDGDLDAFVTNANNNRVWINDGSGSFASGQTMGAGGLTVDLGDLDGS